MKEVTGMKRFIALCAVMTVMALASFASFADSGASHSYKSHKETASVTAPGSNYSIYNLKGSKHGSSTTMYSKTLTKSVSHSSATRGYHTYMTKNPKGTVVPNLSHYGWDT